MSGKESSNIQKRRNFKKIWTSYKIYINSRLCALNFLNKKNEKEKYNKIPLINELELLVKEIHYKNNHCERDQTINYLLNNNWYWYDMTKKVIDMMKAPIIDMCRFMPNSYSYKKKNWI